MGYNFIIAEDHTLVRQALVKLISPVLNVDEFAEANDGREVLTLLREKNHWHLILLDIEMKGLNGIDTLQELSKLDKAPPVIIISMDSSRAEEAAELGAKGYLLKESNIEEVTIAINAVLSGGSYFSPAVNYTPRQSINENPDNPRLVAREVQVLKYVCSGKTSRQIASTLHLSTNTVKTHRKNLMKKASATNLADLMSFAIKYGYMKVQKLRHPKG